MDTASTMQMVWTLHSTIVDPVHCPFLVHNVYAAAVSIFPRDLRIAFRIGSANKNIVKFAICYLLFSVARSRFSSSACRLAVLSENRSRKFAENGILDKKNSAENRIGVRLRGIHCSDFLRVYLYIGPNEQQKLPGLEFSTWMQCMWHQYFFSFHLLAKHDGRPKKNSIK